MVLFTANLSRVCQAQTHLINKCELKQCCTLFIYLLVEREGERVRERVGRDDDDDNDWCFTATFVHIVG